VRGVDALAPAGEPRDEPVEARNRPGRAPACPAEELERPVLKQHVVEVGAGAARRVGRPVGRVAALGERERAVGEAEELEVLMAVYELVEAVQRLLERHRLIDAVQGERRHAAERHRGDYPDRAESHARGA